MFLIDARMLGPENSGIGRYTLNLLSAIDRVGPERPVGVWVGAGTVLPEGLQRSRHLDVRVVRGDPRRLRDAVLRVPRDAAGAGVLHCPDVFAPLRGVTRAGLKTVVTLHDVIPLVCRGQLTRSRKQRLVAVWRAWLKLQTRQAAAVVTVSEHSRRDIERVLRVPRAKVHVIPNAVPRPAPPPDGAAADNSSLRDLGVVRPYLLYVGRRDPYKNVPGLV